MKNKLIIIIISVILVLTTVGVGFWVLQKRFEIKKIKIQGEVIKNYNDDGIKDGGDMSVVENYNQTENGFRTFFNNQEGYKFKYPEYCNRVGESGVKDSGFVLNCINEENNFSIFIKSYDSMISCSSKFCGLEISKQTIIENTNKDYEKVSSNFEEFESRSAIKGVTGDFKINDEVEFMSGVYFDCEESMSCSIEVLGNENHLDKSILDNIISSFEIIDAQTIDELYR